MPLDEARFVSKASGVSFAISHLDRHRPRHARPRRFVFSASCHRTGVRHATIVARDFEDVARDFDG